MFCPRKSKQMLTPNIAAICQKPGIAKGSLILGKINDSPIFDILFASDSIEDTIYGPKAFAIIMDRLQNRISLDFLSDIWKLQVKTIRRVIIGAMQWVMQSWGYLLKGGSTHKDRWKCCYTLIRISEF